VKSKISIVLSLFFTAALGALVTGCGVASTQASTPQTSNQERSYNCLDPRGIQPPVQTSALAPRLQKLDDSTIYLNQGEADPIIMPALWKRVQKDYPKVTWKYIASEGFGPSTLEADVKDTADAVIRGNAW
jgi:hypothetical protein